MNVSSKVAVFLTGIAVTILVGGISTSRPVRDDDVAFYYGINGESCRSCESRSDEDAEFRAFEGRWKIDRTRRYSWYEERAPRIVDIHDNCLTLDGDGRRILRTRAVSGSETHTKFTIELSAEPDKIIYVRGPPYFDAPVNVFRMYWFTKGRDRFLGNRMRIGGLYRRVE